LAFSHDFFFVHSIISQQLPFSLLSSRLPFSFFSLPNSFLFLLHRSSFPNSIICEYPFSFSSSQINKCRFYIKSAQLNFVDLHKIQHLIQRRRQSSTTSFYPFFLINCWLYKLKFKTLMFIFVCNFVCEYCCWIAFIFSIIILFFSFSTQILDVWSYFFFLTKFCLKLNRCYPSESPCKPLNRNRLNRTTYMGGNGLWYCNRRLSQFRLFGPISGPNRPLSSPIFNQESKTRTMATKLIYFKNKCYYKSIHSNHIEKETWQLFCRLSEKSIVSIPNLSFYTV